MRRKRAPAAPVLPGLDHETCHALRRPLFRQAWVPEVVEPYVMKQHWIGVLADPTLPWRDLLGSRVGPDNQEAKAVRTITEHERLMFIQRAVQNAEEDRVIRLGVIAGKKSVAKLAVTRWDVASRVVGMARAVFEHVVEQAELGNKVAQTITSALAQVAQRDMAIFCFPRLQTAEASSADMAKAIFQLFNRIALHLPSLVNPSGAGMVRARSNMPQRGEQRRVPAFARGGGNGSPGAGRGPSTNRGFKPAQKRGKTQISREGYSGT